MAYPEDRADEAITRLLLRLEMAAKQSHRTDDYGVGYRTGLRMAMDIAEGVQMDVRIGDLAISR